MDFSKLSPSQQLTAGAAIVMVIVSFFPWFGRGVVSFNAWESGLAAPLAVVLIVAAAAILVMEAIDRSPVDSPAEVVFYLATAGLACTVWRMIFTQGRPRRLGIYVALIVAGFAAWTAYQNRLDNS